MFVGRINNCSSQVNQLRIHDIYVDFFLCLVVVAGDRYVAAADEDERTAGATAGFVPRPRADLVHDVGCRIDLDGEIDGCFGLRSRSPWLAATGAYSEDRDSGRGQRSRQGS